MLPLTSSRRSKESERGGVHECFWEKKKHLWSQVVIDSGEECCITATLVRNYSLKWHTDAAAADKMRNTCDSRISIRAWIVSICGMANNERRDHPTLNLIFRTTKGPERASAKRSCSGLSCEATSIHINVCPKLHRSTVFNLENMFIMYNVNHDYAHQGLKWGQIRNVVAKG